MHCIKRFFEVILNQHETVRRARALNILSICKLLNKLKVLATLYSASYVHCILLLTNINEIIQHYTLYIV